MLYQYSGTASSDQQMSSDSPKSFMGSILNQPAFTFRLRGAAEMHPKNDPYLYFKRVCINNQMRGHLAQVLKLWKPDSLDQS